MTLEQLLFFLVLLAIPLLQQLVTAMRRRVDAARPRTAEAASAERVVASQPVELARDDRAAFDGSSAPPLVPPPLPDGVAGSTRREAVARPIPGRAPVRGERSGQDLPATAVGAAPASPAKPRRAFPNVIRASAPKRRVALSGEDLRIALVRMAILGPCRALEPRDPSHVA